MTFVIMNVGTERLYRTKSWHGPKYFEEMRYAKAQLTRLNKEYGVGQHVIMTPEEYLEKHDPLVPVYNTITGDGKTPVMIRRSQVGGCCDPSTELYHCM